LIETNYIFNVTCVCKNYFEGGVRENMDYIELYVDDDINKLQDLVQQQAYDVKVIKIIYNPEKYSIRDLEEVQHFIEKHFFNIPISFEMSNTNKNISFVLGIE
jgi:hypothetical protein